ncbi:MAG: bacterioferritin [Bdellovibrionales bacterium]|nr:bacterioferritin [Bdellovibrionales bacterium]
MSKSKTKAKHNPIIDCLNQIFQAEMSGVMRYLHYSFMIMGHNRIPIQKWFRDQADETKMHAIQVGEKITALGGHPTMQSLDVRESHDHDVNVLLKESLHYEEETLDLYKKLVALAVADDDIALEEMARGFVLDETTHIEDVQKMLRKKG